MKIFLRAEKTVNKQWKTVQKKFKTKKKNFFYENQLITLTLLEYLEID